MSTEKTVAKLKQNKVPLGRNLLRQILQQNCNGLSMEKCEKLKSLCSRYSVSKRNQFTDGIQMEIDVDLFHR